MDVVAGVAMAVLAWTLLARDSGEEYRASVLGRGAPTLVRARLMLGRLMELLEGVLVRERTRRHFEAAGIPPVTYLVMSAGLMLTLGAVLWGFALVMYWSVTHYLTGGVAAGMLIWGAPGVFAGWLLNQRLAFAAYRDWRKRLKTAVPGLVMYLRMPLTAGETVAQAVRGVEPFLTGPLKTAWGKALRAVDEGADLVGALKRHVDERFDDPDLSGVLDRLYSYQEESVPAEPFGDLGEHLAQLQSIQATYRVKRMEGPIQLYVMVAVVAALMVTLVPYLVQVGSSMFGF
jgi:Flp pilus assembly protein TadB